MHIQWDEIALKMLKYTHKQWKIRDDGPTASGIMYENITIKWKKKTRSLD
jgi:hypothetical protein